MRIIIFLFLLVGVCQIEAATVHAVIVCDTRPNDIEKTVMSDLKHMKGQAQLISSFTSLKLNLICLSGSEAYPKKLNQVLNGLAVNPDDVVLFYFSGHGFRTQSKGDNPWPNLFFQSVYSGVDFDWVVNKLRKKHPRLIIAMADCCNSYYPDHAFKVYPYEVPLFSKSKKKRNNYRYLFEVLEGEVIAASAKRGQQAWGFPDGGVFTNYVLKAIQKYSGSSKRARWQSILDYASHKSSNWQMPVYSVGVQERSGASFLCEVD